MRALLRIAAAPGRNSDFYDCIAYMLRQVAAYPEMRALVACRKFDLQNDHRIMRLVGEGGLFDEVEVTSLSDEVVREVVRQSGLDPSRLSNRHIKLLSIPLHLFMFTEIVTDQPDLNVSAVTTTVTLFDDYWNLKRRLVRGRAGRDVQWAEIVAALCDDMSENQQLSVPQVRMDMFAGDIDFMVSEHVLIQDGTRIAFFHESFFDYAFARTFSRKQQDLRTFLLEHGDQHLFRRAQVRQILTYERAQDFDRYLVEVTQLLTDNRVRFHLKAIVFALLREVSEPCEEEWRIVAPFLDMPGDPRERQIWQLLNGSASWFRLLASLGEIQRWLIANDLRSDQAVMVLWSVQREEADRVAELVEPFLHSPADAWRNRFAYLMQYTEVGKSRRYFDLFLSVLDRGYLDARSDDFWTLVYSTAETRPDWTAEAIGHFLRRRLDLSLDAGQSNPFDYSTGTISHNQLNGQIFHTVAHGAPELVIDEVLPFVERVANLNVLTDRQFPQRDWVWITAFSGYGYGMEEAILNATADALVALAKLTPERFTEVTQGMQSSPLATVQHLLLHAYRRLGEQFADAAATFMFDRPLSEALALLEVHFSAVRDLLRAITPACSPDHLRGMGKALLAYSPKVNRVKPGRDGQGYRQLALLLSVSETRRSVSVRRRIEALRRKFGQDPQEHPTGVQSVVSPISMDEADALTDDEWVQKLLLCSDSSAHVFVGIHQLAAIVSTQARNAPLRFAHLSAVLPDNVNQFYFAAILRGVSEAAQDVETVMAVCERCHALPTRPLGAELCNAIEQYAQYALPQRAFGILMYYALNSPDPSVRTDEQATASARDVLTEGLNSVRGRAAMAISTLLFADKARVPHFLETLENMVHDPSIGVRSCVVAAVGAVFNVDPARALRLFYELCDIGDALLQTSYVATLFRTVIYAHFAEVRPLLERMLASVLPMVAEAGARYICLASLFIADAQPLAEQCWEGPPAQRQGIASVYGANLDSAKYRQVCIDALIRLFNDDEEEVRSEAANCFRHLDQAQMPAYAELLDAFAHSIAFTHTRDLYVYALKASSAPLPASVAVACERFLDLTGFDAGNMRTRAAAEADQFSELLVRAYQQTQDGEQKTRYLNLVDRMIEYGAFGMDQALDNYER